MKFAPPCVLTINGGSSSIRFALYGVSGPLHLLSMGKVENIGTSDARFIVGEAGAEPAVRRIDASNPRAALDALFDWLEQQPQVASLQAIGHRIVHGMTHTQPERITPALLDELHRITPYDPEHLPQEIELIRAFAQRFPALPQVACFDTAFHRTMPRVAKILPIPRRYQDQGVERYGFHGLSYAYLMGELARIGDPAAHTGRAVLAHLGNGASMAAILDGTCVDTTMGFTPAAGLVMSSRSGDLDPGVAYYLSRTEHMSADKFQHMVNHESGLLGVSGISSDLRDLLGKESTDTRAAEAVQLFCYQARKWLGALTAALGGLDTLVFAGGVGENQPVIRARICAGLGFMGLQLDESLNANNAPLISTQASRVAVRVIRTDEEQMIARSIVQALG